MNYGPQLSFNWIYTPENVCPLKIPMSAKYLLSLVLNMKKLNINLYDSFSNQEIADAMGGSYSTVVRGKIFLTKNGYVAKDGTVLWNG